MNRWDPWEDDDQQLAGRALGVACPRCGRQPGQPCYSWTQQMVVPVHPSRVAAALAAGL